MPSNLSFPTVIGDTLYDTLETTLVEIGNKLQYIALLLASSRKNLGVHGAAGLFDYTNVSILCKQYSLELSQVGESFKWIGTELQQYGMPSEAATTTKSKKAALSAVNQSKTSTPTPETPWATEQQFSFPWINSTPEEAASSVQKSQGRTSKAMCPAEKASKSAPEVVD